MRQRHLPTLGLSWSHLPTLGPGIWTGSCGNGIFQLSVCGKRLQYCKKRETAITTTAPVLQREREREQLQFLQRLQYCRETERNCNYYDRSSIADWEKLQILRPLRYCKKENLQLLRPHQYCREREKLHLLRPPQYCKERETVITATLPAWQTERNCKPYDHSSVAETEKLQLLRPLQIKSWKAANLEESKVGRCVLFQPWGAGIWGAHLPTLRLPP